MNTVRLVQDSNLIDFFSLYHVCQGRFLAGSTSLFVVIITIVVITVAAVWTDATCGNGLRITHSDGYETVYCHLSQSLVKQGEHVDAGCSVAKTGNSGRTTGPHLHYGIKYNGQYIDPTKMVGRG